MLSPTWAEPHPTAPTTLLPRKEGTYRELHPRLLAGVLVRVHAQRDGAVSLLDVSLAGSTVQAEDGVALILAAKLVVGVAERLDGAGQGHHGQAHRR